MKIIFDEKKYKTKRYLHFGKRVGIKSVKNYVKDPFKISSHGFLPFIRFSTSFSRYYEDESIFDGRPIKKKKRNIMYASHLDNYIYRYYGDHLNIQYDKWMSDNKIDEVSIAYRDNKKGYSNIHFAAEVINYVSEFESCYIFVGDFEKFFDTLNHTILKNRVKEIMGTDTLSKDWYRVFKSITRYSYYNKTFLRKKIHLTDKEVKKQNRTRYFGSVKEFQEFKQKYPPNINKSGIGIPQGSAISAVFANVYSTHFDKQISEKVSILSGIYRRYSDDFIIIIPLSKINIADFFKLSSEIHLMAQDLSLSMNEGKTKLLKYENNSIKDLKNNEEKSNLDYLGFVFDGINVRMRGRSPHKFYRKAYKLAEKAGKIQEKKELKKPPYRKMMYRVFSDKSKNRDKGFGNFITYAEKCQKEFDTLSPQTNNLMMQQIRNRRKKVEKAFGIKINQR
ncbi:reverse transcriptase domain-containing protein [Enterococcus sp. AZ126]|uniref:reverse transcriptase domain-containing protein n=1 Tax=Enterococcus sp. AZ126 TaxID=2774635 RepID=UPI003F285152